MSDESKPSKISASTLVPVGMAALVLTAIISAAWYMSGVSKQVEINTKDISAHNEQIQQLPTRQEFSTLSKSIEEIKADIKTLIRER